MIDALQQLAHYDAWANAAMLRSLTDAAAEDELVLRLLGHLTAAKQVWLSRIRGEPTGHYDLWPASTLVQLAPLLRQADGEFVQIAQREDERIIHYQNQSGAAFDTPLSEICVHLSHHGTYHRGQIATAVHRSGGVPAVSDYIVWARLGSPRIAPLNH